jgi:hypothetical protein
VHASPVVRLPVDVPTYHYDVTLTDLDSKTLAVEFAPALQVRHLGEAVLPADYAQRWPLRGIIVSTPNRRQLVSIPVQRGSKCINVIFVVDTGAPFTYISTEALAALGVTDMLPSAVRVSINGVPFSVQSVPADSHFQGVSLLGLDFLEDIAYVCATDRDTRTFELSVGKGAVPAARPPASTAHGSQSSA